MGYALDITPSNTEVALNKQEQSALRCPHNSQKWGAGQILLLIIIALSIP